jgi:toxin ParE1/3/4
MASIDRFRQVEEDLVSIAEFIAHDKPSAARRWLDEIEQKFVLLAQQPYVGEAVDHIRPGLRRVTHGNYLIFYEPHDTGVLLVRVLHGTRRIEDFFRS